MYAYVFIHGLKLLSYRSSSLILWVDNSLIDVVTYVQWDTYKLLDIIGEPQNEEYRLTTRDYRTRLQNLKPG